MNTSRLNTKKHRLLLSSILTILLIVSLFTADGFVASADAQDGNAISINSSTFPDANLRSCLLEMYPDGQISQSEIQNRTSLDISGKGIRNLSGVELFENLQELDCSNNNINQLSINTYLELKKLKSLDISNNASLKSLFVTGFYEEYDDGETRPGVTNYVLEELNASECPSLTELHCGNNLLKNLNIDGCTSLKELDCGNNLLKNLSIDGCTSLTKLDCNSNLLKNLNIDGCTSLTKLDCNSNLLKNLSIDGNVPLAFLYCYSNDIKELDISNCKKLKILKCGDNSLESLDVRNLTLLESLECQKNKLSSLKLEDKKLHYIDCSENKLSSLDLSKVSFLSTSDNIAEIIYFADSYGAIDCSDNLLKSLKLPQNEKISVIRCDNNELTKLDLSKLVLLAKNGYYSEFTYDKNKVKKLLLPKYKIGKLSDKVYKGKPIKHSISSMKLKMGGYKLNKDESQPGFFKTKYKNNNSIGIASVTITDRLGISGTQTFRILPNRAAIKSVKSAKRKLTVKIKKQAGGVKYQVSVKKKGSKAAAKKYTVKKGLTKTIKKLKKKAKYTVKVRAFKKVKGKTYWGKWSKSKTVKIR